MSKEREINEAKILALDTLVKLKNMKRDIEKQIEKLRKYVNEETEEPQNKMIKMREIIIPIVFHYYLYEGEVFSIEKKGDLEWSICIGKDSFDFNVFNLSKRLRKLTLLDSIINSLAERVLTSNNKPSTDFNIITKYRCPNCDANTYTNGVVYPTDPPQIDVKCYICGYKQRMFR